ncbi:MAG: serine/threonine-protein kinase [Byssovorax sp.]
MVMEEILPKQALWFGDEVPTRRFALRQNRIDLHRLISLCVLEAKRISPLRIFLGARRPSVSRRRPNVGKKRTNPSPSRPTVVRLRRFEAPRVAEVRRLRPEVRRFHLVAVWLHPDEEEERHRVGDETTNLCAQAPTLSAAPRRQNAEAPDLGAADPDLWMLLPRGSSFEKPSMFQPGMQIAQYRVLRLLGRGRSTEVYEVLAPGGKRRALKLLAATVQRSSIAQARLAQEAEALSMIEHVHVVRFHDAGEDHGRLWLVEELVEGTSLREVARRTRGPLPVEATVRAVKQACEGLAAAHAVGIVHRHLRPEKIVVTEGEVAKVLDFGSAKLDGWGVKTTRAQASASSPYMAPEHMRTKEAEPASDVYAMGLILYELLAGAHPIGNEGMPAIVICERQLSYTPPALSSVRREVPGDVSMLVEAALSKEPEARPSMAALAEGLGEALHPLQASRRAIARAVPVAGREAGLARTEMSMAARVEADARAEMVEKEVAGAAVATWRSAVLPPAPEGEVRAYPPALVDSGIVTVRSASESWAERGATPAPVVRGASLVNAPRRSGRVWAVMLGAVAMLAALGAVGWVVANGAGREEAGAAARGRRVAVGAAAPASASAGVGVPGAPAGRARLVEGAVRGGGGR